MFNTNFGRRLGFPFRLTEPNVIFIFANNCFLLKIVIIYSFCIPGAHAIKSNFFNEGKILFDGEDLEKLNQKEIISIRRKKIGIIFQSFSLLPLLSAYENVELPLRISGVKSEQRKKMTTKAIETVGLPHRSRHRPYELSGGEQQRIAIARAIVNEPNVILADEPTGELDSVNAEKIFSSFKKLVKDKGITILATTHDRTLLNLSDRVIEISDGKLV